MTRNTVSNANAVIADLAAKSGVTLTESGAEALALIAQCELEWDVGEIAARDAAGDSVPAANWFAAKVHSHPHWTRAVTTTTTPKPETLTERGLRLNAANRQDRTARAKDLHERFGNPWMSSSLNRSRQGIIANANPTLADRLRREASL